MNSALLVIDADGRITACNPPAELILGEQAEALRGRSLQRWFASDAPGEDWIARSLGEGIRFRGAESTITRSDGTRVPIGISCGPIAGGGRRPARGGGHLPGADRDQAAPAPGAPDGEDGLDRPARGRAWRTRSTIRWASSTPTCSRWRSTWPTCAASSPRWTSCARRWPAATRARCGKPPGGWTRPPRSRRSTSCSPISPRRSASLRKARSGSGTSCRTCATSRIWTPASACSPTSTNVSIPRPTSCGR